MNFNYADDSTSINHLYNYNSSRIFVFFSHYGLFALMYFYALIDSVI